MVVVLLVDALLVDAQIGAALAVRVVLDLAAAIVLERIEACGQLHAHTEAEHTRYLGLLVGGHGLRYLDLTLAVDGVCDGHRSLHVGHFVVGRNDGNAVLDLGVESAEIHARAAPCGEAVVQLCTEVILGGCAPEGRSDEPSAMSDTCPYTISLMKPERSNAMRQS